MTQKELYQIAKERYAELGIDTEAVIEKLSTVGISMHCWQGDDVKGFENAGALTGGIQATGNYPGAARTPEELMQDIDKAFSLIPGKHNVNVHACYGIYKDGKVADRDQIKPEHFQPWVDFAKARGIGLDFNPTFFSHPLAENGTLTNPNEEVRAFWIRHGIASIRIAEYFARETGFPCVMNIWIGDGFKDIPADRYLPRLRLAESLDEIFSEKIDEKYLLDAVESKLFGIGVESCTVGSHEFYLMYAAQNNKLICLDSGHFHPTESIADKLSSIVARQGRILLHVSRGVRWDSDHVILLNDELLSIAREAAVYGYLDKIFFCLDYFDASINRIAAMVSGARNMQKALLIALLEPTALLKQEEDAWDFSGRMARQEEIKTLPWASVWRYYCETQNMPDDYMFMQDIRAYEKNVLSARQ